MLSVGTISGGSGYKYLTEEVATGAEDYYVRGVTEIGERPGRWIGSGPELLGLEGVVRPEQMARMYGQGLHPAATPANPVALGPPFPHYKTVPERLAETRAANAGVDAEQWERIEQKIRKAGERAPVAGFDLTFSPPKSWSVLWAAAPDEAAREQVWAAHHEGVDAALAFLEREACFSRTGHAGVRQVDADGFVAAAFDHRQSRDGDPQMHTHVAVLNRVRCTKDGQWRSIDGRELFAAAAAAGGMYDLVRESALERSLGVVHELRRPGDEVREIEGVTDEVIGKFSSRRRAVEARLAPMLAEYEAKHGREASPFIRAQMSEWATLESRPAKGHGETVGDALDRWEARVRGFGTVGLAQQWDTALNQRHSIDGRELSLSDIVLDADRQLGTPARDRRGHTDNRLRHEVAGTLHKAGVDRGDAARLAALGVERAHRDGTLDVSRPEDLAGRAVQRVAGKKATWTRADLARQVERLARRDASTSAAGLQERVDRLVELALRPGGGSVALSAPPVVDAPPGLRRASDGRSEHDRHTSLRYAATAALFAEGRLVETARTTGAPVVTAETIETHIGRLGLGADQAAAARRVLASGRKLDVIVGPAGTGKTHTTAAIAAAWKAEGSEVLGLALSQNAAQVLAEASGNRAENIAKWLLENGVGRPGWEARPGMLVMVDEAGMVPTSQLDQVVGRVIAAGGKVLLVGDPEQFAAPGAGGAMRLLITDVGAARLDEVRRFSSPWEGLASLRLRDGDVDALIEYNRRARICGGTPEQMQQAAYTAWLADTLSGRDSLLLAGTNNQAAELASRARQDLVRAGRVNPDGVGLVDGNQAGVGDRIVTRMNDRRLGEHGRMVANRDEWTVQAVGTDGSLHVVRHDHAGRPAPQTLPGGYVAEHVQLAYASTVHAAQGRTVDTAHAVTSARTGRDGLYVAMTRGRDGNWAYVACDTHPARDEPAVFGDPVATLIGVMTRTEPDQAATEVLRDGHETADSLHTLYPRWKDALDEHTELRWAAAATEAAPQVAGRMRNDPAWPTLVARLQALEEGGADAEAVLCGAVASRELLDAVDVAAVVDWRIRNDTLGLDAADEEATGPGPAVWATFVEATPAEGGPVDAEPLHHYARQLAEQMDRRVEALAERVAADPPRWAEPLGPLPDDPAARLAWTERAAAVAAYKEIIGAGDDDDPLGSRPGTGQRDAQNRWDMAADALYGLPVAVQVTSDDDLQATVDRAAELNAEAPDIVVDRLRDTAQHARDAQTSAGLAEVMISSPRNIEEHALGETAAAAGAELDRLEKAQQQRQDWLADHGPDIAAGPPAAAELAALEAQRAARPYVHLDDDQLHRQVTDAEDDLASIDRRVTERSGLIDHYQTQATHLETEATTTEWERPAWTHVKQERQSETAATARLGEIDVKLDRHVLRGGPRSQERAQLQQEAEQMRSAYPDISAGADRGPVWEQAAETAWAQDKEAVSELRTEAAIMRDKAEAARTTLPAITEHRTATQHRLDQLVEERQLRHSEPGRPQQPQPAALGHRPAGTDLHEPSRPAAAATDRRLLSIRSDDWTARPEDTPAIDPARPAQAPPAI